jgi:hypothetical protein
MCGTVLVTLVRIGLDCTLKIKISLQPIDGADFDLEPGTDVVREQVAVVVKVPAHHVLNRVPKHHRNLLNATDGCVSC